MRFLKRVLKDEKGATMIMVAIAIVVIFGFAVVAIDLSMIQLAKTQLQNAADAGALAGAKFLCKGDLDSARAEAIRIVGLNVAVQDIQRPVIIDESDIQFSDDEDSITVTTHRTSATDDPVSLYFLKVLDPVLENKADVKATATAICGARCLKPFCPPDRWFDANGDGIWNPDSGDYYDPVTTGYMAETDIGDTVTLYNNDPGHEFKMGWYYPVRFPGYSGADDYRNWIEDCVDPSLRIKIGDQLETEMGAMVGPTRQGLLALIGQDPGAYWDEAADTVAGSLFRWKDSPRVIKCPAFDPVEGVNSKWVTIVKILVIFVEDYDTDHKANIIGRFVDAGEDFVYQVSLVK